MPTRAGSGSRRSAGAQRVRLPDRPVTYCEAKARPVCKRAGRDEELKVQIARVHGEHYDVYGPGKVWLQLNREDIDVARCTVERLMKDLGLQGIRRGKTPKTTTADPAANRPADLVGRRFTPARPNALWVADFTYVPTWVGVVYVAFVIDAYARTILGWRAASSMRAGLVLDALDQAVFTRHRAGAELSGLIHHTDAGSQYTSIAFTERVADIGISPSIGTVGDAYDNALAETHIIGTDAQRRPALRHDQPSPATPATDRAGPPVSHRIHKRSALNDKSAPDTSEVRA